jgi:hypothetical protein
MIPAEYSLNYYTPSGAFVTILRYSNFQLTLKENEIGIMTVLVPPQLYSPSFFVRDGIIEVERKMGANNTSLVGKTFWLIRRANYKIDDSGMETVEISAQDTMSILKRRIVAHYTGSAYSKKIDFADDVMKDIIRENFGVLNLDATRNISAWMLAEANTSQGPIVTREVGWQNIYDVLKGISDESTELGNRILFAMERVAPAYLIFRTYKGFTGTDHTTNSLSPVVVSQDIGNLSVPELVLDYFDEKTRIYALGKGQDAARLYEYKNDNTRISGPYGLIEETIDGGDQTDTDVLIGLANMDLYKKRPKLIFDGIILDSLIYTYGVHFQYGDLVTAKYRGYSLNCALDTLGITFSSTEGEQLELRMHGEVLL